MHSEVQPASGGGMAVAWALGVMHAVVDAGTIALLVWGSRAMPTSALGEATAYLSDDVIWNRFLVYTVLAFGTQFSIGAIADRLQAYRGTLAASFALIVLAVALQPFSSLVAVVPAALGNAAFHAGAGGIILTRLPDRSAAAGVLVGPGAVGLSAGMWYARLYEFNAWVLVAPLAICTGAALVLSNNLERHRTPAPQPLQLKRTLLVVCTAAIFLSIAIRSANGHGVWAVHEGERSVLWGLAIAACVGNMAGGFVADRLGWFRTCMLVLILSAPLLSFFVEYCPAAIVGMVLFQMTMPITLMAFSRVFPGEPGLAFGVAAMGVLVGALPVYVCPTEWITPRLVLLSLTLVSVAAIWIGLPPVLRTCRDIAPGCRSGIANDASASRH